MARLVLKYKDSILKEVPIFKDEISIGRRSENDIPIDNLAVSGSHAKLLRVGERFSLEDLDSLNGTFVNGKKVSKVLLNNGDIVTVGKHTLIFLADSDEVVELKSQRKQRATDETIVLDKKVQREILKKTPEVVGGFHVIRGSTEEEDYEITDRITSIGSDRGAGIRMKGLFMPKVAALISRSIDGFFITPSGSRRALKINGKKVKDRYRLQKGDIVTVAGAVLEFHMEP